MRSEETTSLSDRLNRLAGSLHDSSAPREEKQSSTPDVTPDEMDLIIMAPPDPNLAPQFEPPLVEERPAEVDDEPAGTSTPAADPTAWPGRIRQGAGYVALLVMGAFLGWTLTLYQGDVRPSLQTGSVASGTTIASGNSDSEAIPQDGLADLGRSLEEARRALRAAEQRNGRLSEELAEAEVAREAAERRSAAVKADVEVDDATLQQSQTETAPVLHEVAPAQPQPPLAHAVIAEDQPSPREAPPPEIRPEPVIAEQTPQKSAADKLAPKAPASVTPAQTEPGAAALSAGRQHFKKGELVAARRAFERAVEQGLSEGALALGTTFDPVSLGHAGIDAPGDPKRARYWYQKAHELAQSSGRMQ